MNALIAIRDALTRNMTATATLVQATITLLVLFGVPLTTEQVAGLMTFTTAVLVFIAKRADTPAMDAEKIAAAKKVAIGGFISMAIFLGGCGMFSKAVARTALEEAARLLCVQATAEKAGVSAEDIRDTACNTREAWLPFLEDAIAAKRAGAVKAGMAPGPLTPENAVPDLKDPALEGRQ